MYYFYIDQNVEPQLHTFFRNLIINISILKYILLLLLSSNPIHFTISLQRENYTINKI